MEKNRFIEDADTVIIIKGTTTTLELSKIYSGLSKKDVMEPVKKLADELGFDLSKATQNQKDEIDKEVSAIINLDANAPIRLAYIFNPGISKGDLFVAIDNIFIYESSKKSHS